MHRTIVRRRLAAPALMLLLLLLRPLPLQAQGTITPAFAPSAVAGGGSVASGSPYAVFVRIKGWTACAGSQAYLKIYSSTTNEIMWSATGSWSSATGYSTANQPVASINASGDWEGWIVARHNDAVGTAPKLRAAKVGATGTNITSSASLPLTVLVVQGGGDGGWVMAPASAAAGKGILAYAGGTVVGCYRTEDNGVAEGYLLGPGGFRIAVPAGRIDSLVTINADGSRDLLFPGPWEVSAGFETDITQRGKGTATLSPLALHGGEAHDLQISVAGDAGGSIGTVRALVPSAWSWSRDNADVLLAAPGTPAATVRGDTVTVAGLALGAGDTLRMTLRALTPPDTTLFYGFGIGTAGGLDPLQLLGVQPSLLVYGTPTPVAQVKAGDAAGVPARVNTLVTVRGIVTAAGEFGTPSYLQDITGGIAVYDFGFSQSIRTGDEVVVSGLLQPYAGLTEIVNPILHAVPSSGNRTEPLTLTAAQVSGDGAGGLERYEGMLVRLNRVTVAGGGTWQSGTNYPLSDATGMTQLRIDDNTDLVGAPLPASAFDLVGVVGQFKQAAPYIGGYQVMPRSKGDVVASGPVIATLPEEVSIGPRHLTVAWRTTLPGTTGVRYGKTPGLEAEVRESDSLSVEHMVTLASLEPATIYYVGAFSRAGGDTSIASPLIASTASPAEASGAVHVYFNKSVDTTRAWFHPAQGQENLVARLAARLAGARRSIDAALYSLSGTPGPGTDIAAALIAARDRGVHVRVICESENASTSPFTALRNAGIPLITDQYDPVNAGAGLMHNKFLVVDGRGGAPESVWVWTGSWNVTQPGTLDDAQNAVEIQDPALAGAYTREFEEMWGSSTDVPVQAASRFGARKTDNTPHRFVIGGRAVECYFSPGDRVAGHLASLVAGAQHSIAFGLLTLTRDDLAAALAERRAAGLKVRGFLDNGTDQGSEYAWLLARGVDVVLKPSGLTGLLHHKYAVIDGEDPRWGSTVVTGSYNWTGSAESANNENALVIHDGDVANQYLQEFAARYAQCGGTDPIMVGIAPGPAAAPGAVALAQNYPNPFNPSTTIEFALPRAQTVRLVLVDLLGRTVRVLADGMRSAGVHRVVLDGRGLASGVYLYRMETAGFTQVRKLLVLR